MPAKRKRKARDDEGPEDPPLPDEPLPPLDEDPPLPDEEPPPLPDEDVPDEAPPLPDEPVPSSSEDSDAEQPSKNTSSKPETSALVQTTAPPVPEPEPDSWQAIWDSTANAYYFYNPETKETTWLNPRLPPHEAEAALAANPPILDPTALPKERAPDDIYNPETGEYGFTARFNARTGKFQNNPEHTAENFSTLGQIMRTSHDYFDVSQMQKGEIVGQSGGRLKADRKAQMNAMTGKQRKQFVEQMKKKKDQKKREWYADDDIIVRKH
jgi:hypothetical protein